MFEIVALLAVQAADLVLGIAGHKRHKERMAWRRYELEQKRLADAKSQEEASKDKPEG